MSTKDSVLNYLDERRGEFVSGEMLSNELGISRTAVWKAIKALSSEGVEIVSRTNKGYMLKGDTGTLTETGIRKYLKSNGLKITLLTQTSSTNNEAKRLAILGGSEGEVVVALEQSLGKGRQGRRFFSPKGCGVYFSIILRPPRQVAPYITVAAATAVKSAIEGVSGSSVDIKWVNDIYKCGKKCCGILTEAVSDLETGGVEFAVLGIGINVSTPKGGFSDEIKDIAVAVCDGVADAQNRVLAAVLDEFFERYNALKNDFDRAIADIFEQYESGIKFMVGRRALIDVEGGSEEVVILGINDKFNLEVEGKNGVKKTLLAGDVHLKMS